MPRSASPKGPSRRTPGELVPDAVEEPSRLEQAATDVAADLRRKPSAHHRVHPTGESLREQIRQGADGIGYRAVRGFCGAADHLHPGAIRILGRAQLDVDVDVAVRHGAEFGQRRAREPAQCRHRRTNPDDWPPGQS